MTTKEQTCKYIIKKVKQESKKDGLPERLLDIDRVTIASITLSKHLSPELIKSFEDPIIFRLVSVLAQMEDTAQLDSLSRLLTMALPKTLEMIMTRMVLDSIGETPKVVH